MQDPLAALQRFGRDVLSVGAGDDYSRALIAQLGSALPLMTPEILGETAFIPFLKTVSAATQDEQDRQVPFTGVIRDVIMAFPAGCHQLVEVRLVYLPQGGSRINVVPTIEDAFIALDDIIVAFQARCPVKAPGQLRVEWWNYDELNTHAIPVIAAVIPRVEVMP